MKLEKQNDAYFLVDDERISKLHFSVETANKYLRNLSEEIERADYQTNKTYLWGICKEGGNYILVDEEKKVRKWTKDSPLAEASIKRLVDEAIEAVPQRLLKTIENIIFSVTTELKDYPVSDWKGYLDYNEKEHIVCLSPSFTTDNEKKLCRELSEGELVDVEDLLEMLPRLQNLVDKGYNLFDRVAYNRERTPYIVRGVISYFNKAVTDLEERKEPGKDSLTLSMMISRGLTHEEYVTLKQNEELC